VDVLVSPLEIVNNPLICQFFLQDKYVLEKVKDSLFNIKMIKLGYHCFLIFKVPLILINQSISFINYTSNVVKD
jgi:hypothetical protein